MVYEAHNSVDWKDQIASIVQLAEAPCCVIMGGGGVKGTRTQKGHQLDEDPRERKSRPALDKAQSSQE